MKKITIIIVFILMSYLSFYVYSWEFKKHDFEVNFFSLNRGRSIFVRTPGNKTILIGGGQNSDTIRELTKVTPFYSKKIDYVYIPSATPAQIGGLIEIINRYEVGEIIIPKYIATSTVLTILMKEVSKKKIHVERVEEGGERYIDNIEIKVLFPNQDFKFNKTSLPELALSLVYNDTSGYLIGNLSKTIQKNIAKSLKINTTQNIVELYNSATESKVNDELLGLIKPKFIFSTKEKTTRFYSDGFSWRIK